MPSRLKASDIHFEPYDASYRIRCIDGVMQVIHNPPKSMAAQIASLYRKSWQIWYIAERRRAQDGRLKFDAQDGLPVGSRVSTPPTLHGEKGRT